MILQKDFRSLFQIILIGLKIKSFFECYYI